MKKNVLGIIAAFLIVAGVFVLVGLTMGSDKINYSDPYLVLVNKNHPIPDKWEDRVKLITARNSLGEDVIIEENTYEQFVLLRNELLKEGIQIELDSVYRSVDDQQETWDWFVENYGEEYTRDHISLPSFSEHHTGLAVDVYIVKDGKIIRENEDMVADTEDFAKVHKLLPKYGFILRYLPGKKAITGYDYEPWHFRYVGYKNIAKEITEKGITFEEYLGEN